MGGFLVVSRFAAVHSCKARTCGQQQELVIKLKKLIAIAAMASGLGFASFGVGAGLAHADPFFNPGHDPFVNPGHNKFLNPGHNPFVNPGHNPFANPGHNPFVNPGRF